MAEHLVIVESPSKAKTIEKFLGRKYKVLPSVGHIRDLPKSKLGVDVENDFEPEYITIRGKGPIIADLKKEKAKLKNVLIATDPDREGEAIAWHIQQTLGIDPDSESRVTFHEITKDAVINSVKKPRRIDKDLVDSQQARRIVDRLVGYKISPILWRKVMKGLSAGRVQSVATRLIVLREREIRAFVSEEYWTFELDLLSKHGRFKAELTKYHDKKLHVSNEKKANELLDLLQIESFAASDLEKKKRTRTPSQPFTTSTLQQEASNRLNFSSSKTMLVAQKLYEGIPVKGTSTGVITYMRTDSTRVSETALDAAETFIKRELGEHYYKRRVTKAKSGAQDAHEAIRPAMVEYTPEFLSQYLSKDELKLYSLIWERFIASQMAESVFDATVLTLRSHSFEAKARGEVQIFDGFQKIYGSQNKADVVLPEVEIGEAVVTKAVHPEQKFTQPPARYTEASLIKEMEDLGIGRPSTYAPTLYTIIKRGYVVKEKKALKPTELGEVTNQILEENFLPFIDSKFTAQLETKLDNISEEQKNWKEVVKDFYDQLKPAIELAEKNVQKYDLSELTDIKCDKCGAMMLIKKTVKGNFYACSNYPECKNTKPILKEIGLGCPVCKEGQIVERKTKKLKTFWGCSRFPDCTFASWNKPIDRSCPTCGSMLAEGNGKLRNLIVCTNKDCDFKEKK